ncbi:MAG: hypothetical protein KDD70_12435 [Bdellovibrionales bacterium]|nr:hypothetical protein [Bdellovibrionales bacterium]
MTLPPKKNTDRTWIITALLLYSLAVLPTVSLADIDESEIVSPKEGWGELDIEEEEEEPLPFFVELLLWPVNRVLDLVDVVRIDVGAGTSYGGVLRITRQGSLGYRSVAPGSLRIGSFGRKPPILFEEEDEKGAGVNYKFSSDREVCDTEIGVGIDLFLAGYIGICAEGIVDFLGGIIFLDPDDDDIR